MSGSDRSHGTKRMPRSNRTAGSSVITGSPGTNGCSWADRSNWSHRIAGTTGNSGSGRSPGSNRAAGNPGTNWCDGSNRPSRATGESRCNRSGWCRWTSRSNRSNRPHRPRRYHNLAAAVANATSAEDVVNQFNLLLANMRAAGLLAE